MNTAIAITIFGACIYLTGKLGFFQDQQEQRRDRMQHEHNRNLGTAQSVNSESNY